MLTKIKLRALCNGALAVIATITAVVLPISVALAETNPND